MQDRADTSGCKKQSYKCFLTWNLELVFRSFGNFVAIRQIEDRTFALIFYAWPDRVQSEQYDSRKK